MSLACAQGLRSLSLSSRALLSPARALRSCAAPHKVM